MMSDRHFQVKDLCSVDTVVFADSVEWCPIPDYSQYLACALYQLHEGATEQNSIEKTSANNSREGGIKLFKVELSSDSESSPAESAIAREVHTKMMPGVLDMKWCQHPLMGKPALASVNAEGSLDVFRLNMVDGDSELVLAASHNIGPDAIALSVDWSTGRTACDSPRLAVSDSMGSVSLCQLDGCSDLTVLHKWKGHDYEAWISAFDYWQPTMVWSGGDDCRLKVWDTRTDCSKPSAVSKRHTMGVCSLHSSKHHEHIMASGSYDETIFLWDNRQMKAPIAEANVGGGVWRLKWHPDEGTDLLLAACMHNGFHVLDTSNSFSGSSKVIPSILHYQGHESLAYGVAWSRHDLGNACIGDSTEPTGGPPRSSHLVASCSFYDHLMRVWKIEGT